MENKNIIPAFVAKTYNILQDADCQSVISWSPNGKQFLIKNVHALESKVLPKYFRHSNLNSFIRQLNMYGFHKSRKDCSKIVFSHSHFIQGSPELLQKIKRKIKHQIINDQNIDPTQQNFQIDNSRLNSDKQLGMQKMVKQVQNNVILKQDSTEQFKDTYQTINSSTSIMLKPLWSLENTIEQFSTKQQYPFRCFIEKSEIFDLKPDLSINMETQDHHQNDYLLNLNQEEQENTSIVSDFEERRREMENQNEGIPSIKTFHFLNEIYF